MYLYFSHIFSNLSFSTTIHFSSFSKTFFFKSVKLEELILQILLFLSLYVYLQHLFSFETLYIPVLFFLYRVGTLFKSFCCDNFAFSLSITFHDNPFCSHKFRKNLYNFPLEYLILH